MLDPSSSKVCDEAVGDHGGEQGDGGELVAPELARKACGSGGVLVVDTADGRG